MEAQLGGDLSTSTQFLRELENAIVESLQPFSGQELSPELIGEICNSLYKKIKTVGLEATAVGYDQPYPHIDLHIEHPDGAHVFEANSTLNLTSENNVNNSETARETSTTSD